MWWLWIEIGGHIKAKITFWNEIDSNPLFTFADPKNGQIHDSELWYRGFHRSKTTSTTLKQTRLTYYFKARTRALAKLRNFGLEPWQGTQTWCERIPIAITTLIMSSQNKTL